MHLPNLRTASRRPSLPVQPPPTTIGGRAAADPRAALHRRALLSHRDLLWSTDAQQATD